MNVVTVNDAQQQAVNEVRQGQYFERDGKVYVVAELVVKLHGNNYPKMALVNIGTGGHYSKLDIAESTSDIFKGNRDEFKRVYRISIDGDRS